MSQMRAPARGSWGSRARPARRHMARDHPRDEGPGVDRFGGHRRRAPRAARCAVGLCQHSGARVSARRRTRAWVRRPPRTSYLPGIVSNFNELAHGERRAGRTQAQAGCAPHPAAHRGREAASRRPSGGRAAARRRVVIRVDRYSPSWVWASSSAWRTAVRVREAVDDLAPPAGCTHPEAVAKRTRSQHGASGDLPSFRSMSESPSVAGTTAPVFVERSARISEEIGPEGLSPGPWSRRLLWRAAESGRTPTWLAIRTLS